MPNPRGKKMYKKTLQWELLPGHRGLTGRAGHTATLVGKDIYVLGGRNGNEFFNDMWVFDTEIEQWTLLQAKVPFSPRAYHSCTLVNDNELWVIGGSDPKMMHSDVHVFNTVSVKWSCPVLSDSSMTPRGTHAAVLHPRHRRSILIYGGYGGSKPSWLCDLIIFHTDTLEWQDLRPEGAKPKGRGYHTFTVFGNYVALFGGKAEGGIINEENLSVYDALTNRWSMVAVRGQQPSPRSNHVAVLMDDGPIFIHGGRHGSLRLSDAYVLQVPLVPCSISHLDLSWHMIEQSEHPIGIKKTPRKRSLEYNALSGRSAHCLVSKSQELYMFGGYGGEGLTFADMFVLRKFPKIPGLEVRNRSLTKKSVTEIEDIIEDIDGKEDEGREDGGWKSTKLPRMHKKQNIEHLPKFVTANLQSKQGDDGGSRENLFTPETRSTVPIKRNISPKGRALLSVEDRTMEVFFPKELYQKDVMSLQKSVESLKETIKEKTLVDSNFQQRTVQLEQDVQRLEKEKMELQSTFSESEKELAYQNKKYKKLEQENRTLKSQIQDLKYSLDDKENARQAEIVKLEGYEKQLQTLSKSIEGNTALLTEVSLERDKYKSCVHALETELGKQMEALKQVSSRFETEKTLLLKDIADRQMRVDKLLTDLGASKESMKSLEDTINRQARQMEQDSCKITSLQKEKETLTCSNAVLVSENKQLMEAKEGAESSNSLLRSELQSVRMIADQGGIQILQLKEALEQTKEHSSTLHESLKKNEEKLLKQGEEYEKIRRLMREAEEFELAQVRTLQAHAEKLRCARQSCPYQ